MKDRLWYLASPYTHDNPKVMKTRFVQVCKVSAKLLEKGIHTLCPIASSCPIAKHGKIGSTRWEYWAKLDLMYLSNCQGIILSMLDKEWTKSVGMKAEFEHACLLGLPVLLVTKRGKLVSKTVLEIREMFDKQTEDTY